MKKKLVLAFALLAWGLLFSTNVEAQDKSVWASGNNAEYVKKGQTIALCLDNNGKQAQNLDGYAVVRGWFGEEVTSLEGSGPYEFNGPDGWYVFFIHEAEDNATKGYSKARGKYLEVIPMSSEHFSNTNEDYYRDPAKEGAEDGIWGHGFHEKTANYYLKYDPTDNSTGGGGIWVSGGKNFGYPNGSWDIHGWNKDYDNKDADFGHIFGDNTTAMFKGGSNGKKYTIDVTTGKEMTYTAEPNEFMLKFYQSPAYELNWTESKDTWRKYFEFRKEKGNDIESGSQNKETLIDFYDPYNTMDYLMITGKSKTDDPSVDNGNIVAAKITDAWKDDTELSEDLTKRKLPEGYTFEFTIDLENIPSGFDYWRVPLSVNMTQRPSFIQEGFAINNGAEKNFHSTSNTAAGERDKDGKMINGLQIKVQLNDQAGTAGNKRITLRDALRFDWCILYANQNSTNVFYDNLTIEGHISKADMDFLSALMKNARIKDLNMTNAKIYNDEIPDEWAHKADDLNNVTFPSTLKKIGKQAFSECGGLTGVEFGDNTSCEFYDEAFKGDPGFGNIKFGKNTKFYLKGDGVFENCGALPGDLYIEDGSDRLLVDRILEHIAGDGIVKARTFKGCSISKVTIPTNITELNSEAFANCTSLHYVTVPNTVKSMDNSKTGNYVACADDAFKGVYSNQCEVVFTGNDDESNYRDYRNSQGWMYLLTKSIYELYDTDDKSLDDVTAVDIPYEYNTEKNQYEYNKYGHSAHVSGQHDYDLCHQKHADVRLFREFKANNIWDTMVLPFDVNAGTDKNNDAETTIRTKNGNIQYAAIYFRSTDNHVDLLNVGGHNTTGNSSDTYGTHQSANYKLAAGRPFFVRLSEKASDNVYTFVNVETKAAQKHVNPKTLETEKLNMSVITETIGNYTFTGTYNAIQSVWDAEKEEYVPWNVESMGGVWAMSYNKDAGKNLLVHAKKTAKFKGYRCWFQLPEGGDAKDVAMLSFDVIDDGITAIQTVEDSTFNTQHSTPNTPQNNIYDLSGRRVNCPTRGIYIQNGKKFIIK